MSDDEAEVEQQQQAPFDIETWRYDPPPKVQGTFYFEEDRLLFDSDFDSGNLMDVERVGVLHYNLYLAPDCANTPKQTTNKQWFHFSICGGLKGQTVTLSIVNIPCCKMYSFPGYAPTVALVPQRPSYTRLNTKVHVKKLDPVSPTNAGPSTSSTPTSAVSSQPSVVLTFDMTPSPTSTPPAEGAAAPKKKGTTMCNLTFDYTFEVDSLLKDPSSVEDNQSALRHPGSYTSTTFVSNAHPYSYTKLQRQLASWDTAVNGPLPCTAYDTEVPAALGPPVGSGKNAATRGGAAAAAAVAPCSTSTIYFHRELLTYSLDRNRMDLLTISGTNGMSPMPSDGSGVLPGDESYYEPMLDAGIPVPPSLAGGLTHDGLGAGGSDRDDMMRGVKCCPKTGRARTFPKKKYVIISARVHPGEIPASHILHGVIEFLLNRTDPRAKELRKNFVFVIVPMINPDGVVRGHSRADTTGQNLNRTYAKPCPRRHPTTFALRKLLFQLQNTSRLSVYVDLHAHANKRGMFFYGNGMTAIDQIRNLLYAKLVSINTPYFEFQSCNFSEQNMFAVGKNGEGKDSSSRVVLFKETGFINSYTLESNYLCGTTLNDVKGLGAQFPGEESGTMEGTPSPKYTLTIFHDVGRALAVSVADLHSLNPASRLPISSFHNLRGVALWIQRALIVDGWEQVRRQQILTSGASLSRDREKGQPAFSTMAATKFPDVLTTRPSKTFPPTTVKDLSIAARATSAGELTGVEETESSASSSASGGVTRKTSMVTRSTRKPLEPSGAIANRRASASAVNTSGSGSSPSSASTGRVSSGKVPSLQIGAAPRTRRTTSFTGGSNVK